MNQNQSQHQKKTKTPPTITGVEDGKTYKQSVTPKAEDENLKEVILIKDGKEVTNYKNGGHNRK